MKIIFLDIDGVLNSQLYHGSQKNPRGENMTRFEYELEDLDERAIGFLNDLIKDTDAKVVISSTWRLNRSIEHLTLLFKTKKFEGKIIGFTPRLGGDCCRGDEIYKWVKDNSELLGCPYYDFNSYVILDDDSDMLLRQRENFIWVDGYIGLTPTNVYKATWILNKRCPSTKY